MLRPARRSELQGGPLPGHELLTAAEMGQADALAIAPACRGSR